MLLLYLLTQYYPATLTQAQPQGPRRHTGHGALDTLAGIGANAPSTKGNALRLSFLSAQADGYPVCSDFLSGRGAR